MAETKSAKLTVTARPARGFRRAGRHWPPEPTTVDAGAFTAEELAALKAEPNLVVTEAPTEGGGQAKGKGS